MRNKFLKMVSFGLSLALMVTSANLPTDTASANHRAVKKEKVQLSTAKKTILFPFTVVCFPSSVSTANLL